MINVLLVENDMNYGKNLINKLARKNKEFRLCGLTNNIKDTISILNNIEIDIILINLALSECKKIINLLGMKKCENLVILILNEKNEINIINNGLKRRLNNYIIKSNDIGKDTDIIDSLFILKSEIHLSKKSKIKEMKIKSKINEELKYLGYNLEYLGSKYLSEAIYILYITKNYQNCNLERDIYPIIAKKNGKSINNIKCNIKNATNIMYYENEEEKIIEYLKDYNIIKPQPKKIILTILNRINL